MDELAEKVGLEARGGFDWIEEFVLIIFDFGLFVG